jgi:hypothetical protein
MRLRPLARRTPQATFPTRHRLIEKAQPHVHSTSLFHPCQRSEAMAVREAVSAATASASPGPTAFVPVPYSTTSGPD